MTNKDFNISKRAGMFSAPPMMAAEFTEWAIETYKKYKKNDLEYMGDKEYKWGASVLEEGTLPVDLSFWKFENKVKNAPKILHMEFIKYHMSGMAGDTGVSGFWDPKNNTIAIGIDPRHFNLDQHGIINDLFRNIAFHELQHFGQTILQSSMGEGVSGLGFPSKKILEKTEPDPFTEHALHDAEFYPDILNEITQFNLLAKLHKYNDDKSIKKFFDAFVKEREFWWKLKRKNPEKFRKALIEFYKAVISNYNPPGIHQYVPQKEIDASFNISKRAALENPARMTAQSLFKIIKFLFYRVPPAKRPEFFSRLKGKIMRVSPGEISIKKLSPSSSIGQAISLSKNLLSGLNPNFVRAVLVELTHILSNIGLAPLR